MGLTPTKVVDGAALIADRDGLDGLSLSVLADALGVRVPSLYKHVQGLDNLRERLAERAAIELDAAVVVAIAGQSGHEALLALAVSYRRWAMAHRGLYAALPFLPAESPLPGAAALARVAADYGQSADVAAALRSALHGHVLLEQHCRLLDADQAFGALVDVLDRGLSAPEQRRGFRLGSLSLPGLPGLGR